MHKVRKLNIWHVVTYPLFNEFECTLIFRDLQQFHCTFLVRGKTADLTDQISDKLGVLGQPLKKTIHGTHSIPKPTSYQSL